ncbi:PadR family transcriptional regulator [Olivibacter sitiensis]|uniref:PadR family transcriptional regulator n=1 Tax=Olivibacter sitiensis TaxID=376470 RepID=UPI000411D25E|nr:PadR family transcriptional regulator [Olivibacter sitiensis]
MYFIYICPVDSEFVNKWKSQVKKGTLTFIILNLLKKQEYYGYDLIEQIRQHTAMEVAEGTLYPLLNRLKNDGLISSKWVEQASGIPRKYYALADEGRRSLTQMQHFWEDLENAIKHITEK